MGVEIEFEDNSNVILSAFKGDMLKALETVGLVAESDAKLELENNPRRIDTGALRNSITHRVIPGEKAVYIGSNISYSVFVHEGTGIYSTKGSTGNLAGKSYWVYVKGSQSSSEHKGKRYTLAEAKRITQFLRSKGLEAYYTQGMRPNRFLKNAVEKNIDDYKKIIEEEGKS
ncbi:MAG: hypothetical protein II410_02975 [Ruminococcus sp.]|nr:hypothetical protein [Ruminococcus sp.]